MHGGAEGPQRVGTYRVEGVLGRGGMGVVYRAVAPDGTPVALKMLREQASDDTVSRFHREAAVRVEHPNVVRLLDVGTEERAPFIVFELLEGESFEQRWSREAP